MHRRKFISKLGLAVVGFSLAPTLIEAKPNIDEKVLRFSNNFANARYVILTEAHINIIMNEYFCSTVYFDTREERDEFIFKLPLPEVQMPASKRDTGVYLNGKSYPETLQNIVKYEKMWRNVGAKDSKSPIQLHMMKSDFNGEEYCTWDYINSK